MNYIEVFKTRHHFAREIFYDYLFDDYSEADLRTAPHESLNSIIWNLWHVARVEDAGVTRFVTGREQVLYRDNWNEKMKINVKHFGYGAPREDMLALSEKIDFGALRGYWQAVVDDVFTSLGAVSDERFNEVLSEDEVKQVTITEEVVHEFAHNDIPYAGWTRLEALYHFSVLHYYWHGGEVRTIQGYLASQADEVAAE